MVKLVETQDFTALPLQFETTCVGDYFALWQGDGTRNEVIAPEKPILRGMISYLNTAQHEEEEIRGHKH